MLIESTHSNLIPLERRPFLLWLIAAVCAVVMTGLVFWGYAYLRERHSQQMRPGSRTVRQAALNSEKRLPKAHILVDDALLKGGQTIIGGTVKNISTERLAALSVELELRRRKDGVAEHLPAMVNPSELAPQQEGRYSIKLPSQQYLSVRLAGLKGEPDSALLPFTASPGQKRPLERLEPKVVTIPRSVSRGGEFLNSPDKPARVP